LNCIILRSLTIPLHRAAALPEPLVIEGPRGAGKTTLLRREFPRRLYLTLEDAADRRAARRDPAAFLARLRVAAIIDEVHRAPELVTHLARGIEPRPITLVSSLKLSLPLRTLRLYHPTQAEREGRPPLPIEMLGHFVPVRSDGARAPARWPGGYSPIERDVQELMQVRDPDRFGAFVQVAREHSGRVLDQQRLGRLAGVSATTAVRWLSVLDACFLTIRLEPCGFDFGRRLTRHPKLHFLDGVSLESKVVSEIYRNAAHTGQAHDLRYWRDSNGLEIPLVLQFPGSPPMPVAIVEAPNPAEDARLQRWMKLAGTSRGAMVSLRSREHQRGQILRYTVDQL
jgi:hypothetical protein